MNVVQLLSVSGIYKAFDSQIVLSGVSFSIDDGEVFGILGPNGAGKTTLLRIIMDIIKADKGEVNLFNKRLDEELKRQIGYLPEERGLYRGLKVIDSLVYFGTLKGMSKEDARKSALKWLKKIGMEAHSEKKINELSKGMAQKIQFIVSLLHNPSLIVLDEPFSGLDPVNSKLIKDLILELKESGKTIVLSTHQMDQVEKMCDRVLMVNKGSVVLYGRIGEVKAEHGANSITVEYQGKLPAKISGVEKIEDYGKYAELKLAKATVPGNVLKTLVRKGLGISRFEVGGPSLNEIFISLVQEESR